MTNNIFAETISTTKLTGSHALAGTARLTSIASVYAAEFMTKLTEIDDELIAAAMQSNSALDKLISDNVQIELTDDDREFFAALSNKEADGMLKSQQSKRSRCKSKVMTIDNFRDLATAAISETVLRTVYNKARSTYHRGAVRAAVSFTEEELQQLSNDQEALGRMIRNLQSKKSIAKSKVDFDPESEYWQQLLEAESKLKSLRVVNPRSARTDKTKAAVTQLLTDVDIDNIKAAEAKALLSKILGLTVDDVPETVYAVESSDK